MIRACRSYRSSRLAAVGLSVGYGRPEPVQYPTLADLRTDQARLWGLRCADIGRLSRNQAQLYWDLLRRHLGLPRASLPDAKLDSLRALAGLRDQWLHPA